MLFEFPADLSAWQSRQAKVQNYGRGHSLAKSLDSRVPVRRYLDRITFCFKQTLESFLDCAVVFNYQDPVHRNCSQPLWEFLKTTGYGGGTQFFCCPKHILSYVLLAFRSIS
jgi:hypothetical protein